MRFAGTCEELCPVDVSELVAWIEAISFEDWPQQNRLADGRIRPAMASGAWHGLEARTNLVVANVMAKFPGCRDYNRMLSVVMPGHSIEPHRDPQGPHWCARVHVPLTSNAASRFITGGIAHNLQLGFAYLVNTEAEHSVENDGPTPRIHFMWDIDT